MTSRERVVAALEFQTPDRTPRDLWALPYIGLTEPDQLRAVQQKYPSDIGRPELSPGSGAGDLQRLAKIGTYVDEWGSVWEVGEPGIIGEVKKPALDDWGALERFEPPWHLLCDRDMDHANRMCDESDLFMLSAVTARPFERLQFLRGSENLFMDLAYDTAEIRKLTEIVHRYYLADVTAWAESNVDAVFLMDDWGTNQSLLINPEMWRAVFKPLYKAYCDIIHGHGKYVLFHSDGHTESIYGDLIEIGVDAINSQLFCMDIEGLGEKYRGQVTFWGEIDRQHVLPFGSPEDVQNAVARVRQALDTGQGGVIAQCEWGKDNNRENIETVFDAWL